MRPREREQETPPPPPSSSPPRRIKGSLSSMVVRASDSAGGGGGGDSDFESSEARKAGRWKQDEAPAQPLQSRSRRFSEDSASQDFWFECKIIGIKAISYEYQHWKFAFRENDSRSQIMASDG